jgi:hypothetical protein
VKEASGAVEVVSKPAVLLYALPTIWLLAESTK